MKLKMAFIFRKISRAAFVIGTLSLIVGFVLSFMSVPASASESEAAVIGVEPQDDNQISACVTGFSCIAPGCNPDPYISWTAPDGFFVCAITIRYGPSWTFSSDGCVDANGDGVGDYCAGGIGTGVGEAERVCEGCNPMIGVKFYIDSFTNPTSTPTDEPSPTPTDTDVPSPTPTDTDVPSPTPTDTDVPTPTPTETDVPTETPTSTPTSTSLPTETEVPGTSTPTVTGTPPTPTSTDVPTSTSTATSTSTSTSTPLATVTGNPTATVTSTTTSTSTPTSTVTPVSPATMPPPSGGTTTPALVPVTGIDLSATGGQGSVFAGLLINVGIGMMGLALVFHGLGKRLSTL